MFSDRFPPDVQKNNLTEVHDRRRAAGLEVIDLTVSNPTQAGFTYPSERILRALSNPAALVYEPLPQGLDQGRESVCHYYSRRKRARPVDFDPSDVFLTASTSEAYSYLIRLFANPHGRILIPQPSYPLFEFLAAMESVESVPYRISFADRWEIDLEDLFDKLKDNARALFLVHPNNPTGSFVHPEEWSAIRLECEKCGIPIICDEVFFDYPLNQPAPLDLSGEDFGPLFLLNGLSKIAGLPQMKLAWILMRGPHHIRENCRSRLEILADTYLSVSTPVQHAAEEILTSAQSVTRQIQERVYANFARLRLIADRSPVDVFPVEGGWYAILRLPAIRTDEAWAVQLLQRVGVLVHPGYLFGFRPPGVFAVLSLLTPSESFGIGIERIWEEVGRE